MYARSVHSRGWLFGLLVAVPGLVLAEEPATPNGTCYEIRNRAGSGIYNLNPEAWYADGMAACESLAAKAQAAGYGSTYVVTGFSWPLYTQVPSCLWDRTITATGQVLHETVGTEKRVASNQAQCFIDQDPPAECGDSGDWWFTSIRGLNMDEITTAVGSCFDGCGVSAVKAAGPGIDKNPDGTFSFPVSIQSTGASCTGGGGETEPAAPPEPETNNENCVTSSAGVEYCSGPYGENCGYVNDQFTCLGRTDSDECWVMTDGSRMCGSNAPMPPVPDNGTAGVPATPDDTVQASGGDTINNVYNFYNSTTVTGSSRPVGDSGANPNRPSSGDPATGAGDGEGEETAGSASGGTTCDSPPVCEGDPIQCAILSQEWRTRCVDQPSESELVAEYGPASNEDGSWFDTETRDIGELSDFAGGWMGAGACIADYSLNLGGMLPTVEIPFSEWCWLLEVIGIFTMIAAYVSGARIIIGGF